jgi:putative heme-binding domain-containing protein
MNCTQRLCILPTLLVLAFRPEAPAQSFELRDGDRVAFIGDVLVEREQVAGHIETMLTLRHPDRHVTFRNLGWSGDRPDGIAREGLSLVQAGREPEGEGFTQLKKQIELVKPTVVFLGYGMASSLDKETSLETFLKDMERLMDAVREISGGQVRFVILSPVRHENLGPPWPDAATHNQRLSEYTAALRELATKRGAQFVDLFTSVVSDRRAAKPLTQNGIHLNDDGYRKAAVVVEGQLGWKPLRHSPAEQQRIEKLREVIVAKNVLWFDRSRPQNMAYIFGFRKHEQGRNAAEIPQFDALIEKEEARIAQLRRLPAVPVSAALEKSAPAAPAQPVKLTTVESMNFTIADGFEVNLYAQNPLLEKPINMNFDPQGRLWVASSSVYPQIQPGQVADDRIIVLEDTNGDGVAEKSTSFADGLLIPSTVLPGDGGVYVGQSTELLHFADTDGDGKADQKRIVLSGFGTEDTHHTLHTLRWGYDGNIYLNQSVYIRTHLETPGGIVRLKAGGIISLRPDNLRGDIFIRGLWNTWGHHWDHFGQSFATDGAGFNGLFHLFPGASFNPTPYTRRVMDSISPGNYPKFCGLEFVASEQFPPGWQGDFLTCDFRAHRIVRFKLTEDGAGYATSEMPDLLRTPEATFRPIDVKFGPDGALYIADWSNPIIQHGEVDFRDPRRDKVHGRIWRVTYKNRPLVKSLSLPGASNEALLQQLASPNGFQREQARRVLTERGPRILPDLRKWTAKQTDEQALLESIWLFKATGDVDIPLLEQLLKSRDPRVRAAATRVLYDSRDQIRGGPATVEPLVNDSHPRVRLEALRLLAVSSESRAAEMALRVLNLPMDRFLDYALWLTLNDLAEPWIAALKSGQWEIKGREKQLEFALKAIEPALASTILSDLLAQNPIPRDGSGPWIELIGQAGGANELRLLWEQILKGGFDDAGAERAANSLAEAMRLRKMRPAGDLAGTGQLLGSGKAPLQAAAARLAGSWKQGQFIGQLLKLAEDVKTPAPVRDAAFDGLREIGGKGVTDGLARIAGQCQDDGIHRQAALTLAGLNFDAGQPHVLTALARAKDDNTITDIWRAALNSKGAAARLAAAVPNAGLPKDVARAGLRVAREGGRTEPELVLSLSKAAGLLTSTENMTDEQLQALTSRTLSSGNPARGELIYRRTELGCVTCHAIGGIGGKVGPDMTSIGASAPLDYLVESLVRPNAKIKEGFHSVIVQTKDEQEFSGIVARETDRELVLLNAANQEVSVAKNSIATRKNGLSLMPAGLIDALTDDERADLASFLSALGKPGRFDASKGNVARSWKLLAGTHRIEQFGVDKIVAREAAQADWKPALTFVDGSLPRAQLEEATATVGRHVGLVSVFAEARFQTAKTGRVRFNVPAGRPLVWINGQAVKTAGNSFEADLSAGAHTITLRFDAKALPDVVKLESADVTFVAN